MQGFDSRQDQVKPGQKLGPVIMVDKPCGDAMHKGIVGRIPLGPTVGDGLEEGGAVSLCGMTAGVGGVLA
jgi:hypothetical protein